MRRWLLWLPLLLFLLVLGLVALGLLKPGNRTVRSQLLGKPMPVITLPAILPTHPGFRSSDGGPRLVNIFASWCVPCAVEVGQLAELKKKGVLIDGIAVRDRPEDLARFLSRHGDPYHAIGSDPESRSMIALGSSGVPESFVVDTSGIIRYQHIGAIGPQDLAHVLRAYEQAR